MAERHKVIIANQIITGTGADAAGRPSVNFGDADTGFYESTDDKLTVTLGGTDRFHFSGSAFTQADGTAYITSAVVGADAIANREVSGGAGAAGIGLNKLMNGTQGLVLYYNSASKVSGLAVGTAGQFLTTNGAGADPSWTTAATGETRLIRKYISGSSTTGVTTTIFDRVFTSGQLITKNNIFFQGFVQRTDNNAASVNFRMTEGTNETFGGPTLTTNGSQQLFVHLSDKRTGNNETQIYHLLNGTGTLITGTGTAGWLSGGWRFRVECSGLAHVGGELMWYETT